MLKQVLREIEASRGTVKLNDLAHKLGVEPSALEGMIEFWVRKGRLKDDERASEVACTVDSGAACGGSCPGPQGCPFIMKMPRTYALTLSDND